MAAMVSLFVLVPLSIFINWRLAILLIILCVLFAALAAMVVRKTELMQRSVQAHHSDLAERASDALGNIALVQSFARVEHEVTALKSVSDQLLAAQFPVLSWWAVVAVLTRASTTLTVLSIILAGTWFFQQGLISIGEIVTFMAFAGMVIGRLEQTVNFINRLSIDAAQLREFFGVLDTVPAIYDRPDAVAPEKIAGRVEFKGVSFSYSGRGPAVESLSFTALPGETVGAGRCNGCRQVDGAGVAAPCLRSAVGCHHHRRHGYPRHQAGGASPQHRRGVSGSAAVQPLDC